MIPLKWQAQTNALGCCRHATRMGTHATRSHKTKMATLQPTTGDVKSNTGEDISPNAKPSKFHKMKRKVEQLETSQKQALHNLKAKGCCLGFEPFHKTTR